MVTHRRGLHPDAVVDLDVGGEGVVTLVVRRRHRRVGPGRRKGTRDVVVSYREDDRVGVVIIEGIHQRGQVRRRLRRKQPSLSVRKVQKLERIAEGSFHSHADAHRFDQRIGRPGRRAIDFPSRENEAWSGDRRERGIRSGEEVATAGDRAAANRAAAKISSVD